MNGGYQILDLSGMNSGGGNKIIPGIYDAIEQNVNTKPILIRGIEFSDPVAAGFYAPTLSGSNFVFSVDRFTITVSDNDNVNITY